MKHMEPSIVHTKERSCIGISLHMDLVNNLTATLWSSFMPRRKEIRNRVSRELISLQEYPPNYHTVFNPAVVFKKWALAEVSIVHDIPMGMETFSIKEGIYAVFNHKGASWDASIFEYIYAEWLPKSQYLLDDRPHFEVLGATYKNNDHNAEEEIWIPIKKA